LHDAVSVNDDGVPAFSAFNHGDGVALLLRNGGDHLV
jgi:hypothetical protein